MTLYIPLVKHHSHVGADFVAGNPQACGESFRDILKYGRNKPDFDTLISVYNQDSSSIIARVKLFNGEDGTPILWPPDDAEWVDIPLHSESETDQPTSFAFTFINWNFLESVPHDFCGFGKIETVDGDGHPTDQPIAGAGMTAGGGPAFDHWNNVSSEMSFYATVNAQAQFAMPYVIPYYDDPEHHDSSSFRTTLVVTNFDDSDSYIHFHYTIGDGWASAGTTYSFVYHLSAWSQLFLDLYSELLNVGYSSNTGSLHPL